MRGSSEPIAKGIFERSLINRHALGRIVHAHFGVSLKPQNGHEF